jgi:hypothetical protein
MPRADQGSHFTSFDELPAGHRRMLNRRSSCPSIPRSVSAYSSICALDLGSEDPSVLTDWDDVEMYKSPLFRGLEGVGEGHGDAAKRVSPASTGGFTTPSAKAIDCDDSASDSLSNYQFDITEHHVPEPSKASKGKLSREQSSTLAHPRPLRVPDKPLNRKASRPLLPPRDPSPNLQHFPPSVPPKDIRPIAPLKTGTRPLQIDRSKKHTGSSSTSQRVPRADAQHMPLTPKPISRATTHINLREAYRRDSPLAERRVPTKGVTPIRPSHLHPHPKTPNQNVTQVIPNHYLRSVLHRTNLSHSTANPHPHVIFNKSHSS